MRCGTSQKRKRVLARHLTTAENRFSGPIPALSRHPHLPLKYWCLRPGLGGWEQAPRRSGEFYAGGLSEARYPAGREWHFFLQSVPLLTYSRAWVPLSRSERQYFQMSLPGNRPVYHSDEMQSVSGKRTERGVHARTYRQRPEETGQRPKKTANNRRGRNGKCFSRSTPWVGAGAHLLLEAESASRAARGNILVHLAIGSTGCIRSIQDAHHFAEKILLLGRGILA